MAPPVVNNSEAKKALLDNRYVNTWQASLSSHIEQRRDAVQGYDMPLDVRSLSRPLTNQEMAERNNMQGTLIDLHGKPSTDTRTHAQRNRDELGIKEKPVSRENMTSQELARESVLRRMNEYTPYNGSQYISAPPMGTPEKIERVARGFTGDLLKTFSYTVSNPASAMATIAEPFFPNFARNIGTTQMLIERDKQEMELAVANGDRSNMWEHQVGRQANALGYAGAGYALSSVSPYSWTGLASNVAGGAMLGESYARVTDDRSATKEELMYGAAIDALMHIVLKGAGYGLSKGVKLQGSIINSPYWKPKAKAESANIRAVEIGDEIQSLNDKRRNIVRAMDMQYWNARTIWSKDNYDVGRRYKIANNIHFADELNASGLDYTANSIRLNQISNPALTSNVLEGTSEAFGNVKLNISPSTVEYSLQNNKLKRSVFEGGTQYVPDKPLIEKGKQIISDIETEAEGSVVFGSLRTFVEGNNPHVPKDIEVLIAQGDFDKLKAKHGVLGIDGFAHEMNINGKRVGFVPIEEANGKAKGKIATEIFGQYFPEEYHAAQIKSFETGSNTIDIPYGAQELLDKVKENPLHKTILDMMEIDTIKESSKKGINRLDAMLNYGNTESVLKAQMSHVKRLVGEKGSLPKTDLSDFSNAETNKEILKKIKFIGDENLMINDPARMQIAVNDWFINETIVSRGVAGSYANGSYSNLLEYLLDWQKIGGTGSGSGNNTVRRGFSGHGTNIAHFQLPYKQGSNVLETIDNIYGSTVNRIITPDEQELVSKILSSHGLAPLDPSITSTSVFMNARVDVTPLALDEIGKALDVVSANNSLEYSGDYKGIFQFLNNPNTPVISGSKDSGGIPKPISKTRRLENAALQKQDIIKTTGDYRHAENILKDKEGHEKLVKGRNENLEFQHGIDREKVINRIVGGKFDNIISELKAEQQLQLDSYSKYKKASRNLESAGRYAAVGATGTAVVGGIGAIGYAGIKTANENIKANMKIKYANENMKFISRFNDASGYEPLKDDKGNEYSTKVAIKEYNGEYMVFSMIIQNEDNSLKELPIKEAYQYAIENKEFLLIEDRDIARKVVQKMNKK
jgi:hypothetical protein